MNSPSFLRSPRTTPTGRARATAGLLPAALATLLLGASVCVAAQPGATPPPPARTPQAAPLVRSTTPVPVAPTATPATAAPAVEAGDTESSGTLSGADLDKALSNDLVTLDTANLRILLGQSPDFVYDPHNRRDPMVLPWEHLRVRATALLAEATRAMKFGNLDMAGRLYGMVRDTVDDAEKQDLPGKQAFEELRDQADAGLQKIQLEKQHVVQVQGPGGTTTKSVVVQLPMWVRTHTSGVIFSKTQPLCLVGPYTLKVGDKVPGQPVDVEVVKIEKRAVTYRVAGETFVVGLEEGE